MEGILDMRRYLIPLITLAVLVGACSTPQAIPPRVSAGAAQPVALPPLDPGDEPVAAVVERVLPSVVNVTTNVFRADPLGGSSEGQGVGTGFIVRPDGVIVTNCHVVEGASRITVSTSEKEPQRYQARVIGGDCEHDLAVLKVRAEGLPTVALGDSSSLRLGQRVVALGYALALEGGPSVTTGIVSSLDRTIRAQDLACPQEACPNGVRTYTDAIQTDAAINHGNSGGPLVDMEGRVIGINSAGNDTAENIGFAIAIDSVEPAILQAIDAPLAAEAYLGVSTTPITSDLSFQFNLTVDRGAFVLGTTGNGPAAAAGIREGDVITAIDGRPVASAEDVGDILGTFDPGDRVEVELVGTDGSVRTIEVTLGTRPLPTTLP
jgi:S1-C subfamily serine protease